MKYEQINPIEEPHCNRIFTLDGCGDLPATVYFIDESQEHRAIASHYRLSVKQRIKFLFSGKIYVSVLGLAQPPIAVGIGNLFEKNPATGATNGGEG